MFDYQNPNLPVEQRVADLRTAEIVAMQAIPMIRTMQYSNLNLVRKINSADYQFASFL